MKVELIGRLQCVYVDDGAMGWVGLFRRVRKFQRLNGDGHGPATIQLHIFYLYDSLFHIYWSFRTVDIDVSSQIARESILQYSRLLASNHISISRSPLERMFGPRP
jgi:hypothetical protein